MDKVFNRHGPGATQQKAGSQRQTDIFRITSGALGPVPVCELEIKPFTVFVGRQGTGKSLVAQTLYFFEELPFLAAFVKATERNVQSLSSETIVRRILDQLRSHQRAFATFANKKVTIEWTRSKPFIIDGKEYEAPLKFSAYSNNRLVVPGEGLLSFVAAAVSSVESPWRHAVFLPTERLVISQLRSAIAEKVLSLPITYTLFFDWMNLASRALSGIRRGSIAKEQLWVENRGQEALGGEVVRRGEQWKWRFGPKNGQVFDLDMASSGQRANWSIVYLAKALFAMRVAGEVARTVSIFVEEPEIHLHPAAQVAMLEVLAYLVKNGFRVVVTTHSLDLIYALNNLIQASSLGERVVEGAPPPEIRLSSNDVAVYNFVPDRPPQSIVDRSGFIDEGVLGEVAEELTASMNTIGANLPPVEN